MQESKQEVTKVISLAKMAANLSILSSPLTVKHVNLIKVLKICTVTIIILLCTLSVDYGSMLPADFYNHASIQYKKFECFNDKPVHFGF